MAEERTSVYEARVNSGKTTYFIDARRAVNGRYYLSITESRRTEGESFSQRRVMVFEEGLDEFRRLLGEAADSIAELVAARPDSELIDVRTAHPKAFTKWSQEEEEALEREFRKNPDVTALAGFAGRTEKAVLARLEKMGLVEPATAAVS